MIGEQAVGIPPKFWTETYTITIKGNVRVQFSIWPAEHDVVSGEILNYGDELFFLFEEGYTYKVLLNGEDVTELWGITDKKLYYNAVIYEDMDIEVIVIE